MKLRGCEPCFPCRSFSPRSYTKLRLKSQLLSLSCLKTGTTIVHADKPEIGVVFNLMQSYSCLNKEGAYSYQPAQNRSGIRRSESLLHESLFAPSILSPSRQSDSSIQAVFYRAIDAATLKRLSENSFNNHTAILSPESHHGIRLQRFPHYSSLCTTHQHHHHSAPIFRW